MSVINPPKARHSVQEVRETLIVNIPSRINWLQIPGLLIWLTFWLFSLGAGFFGLLSADGFSLIDVLAADGPVLFMLLWLTFWITGGLLVFLSLLWQFTGREVVIIDDEVLRIRWQILGFSWLKSYPMADLRDLRVSPVISRRNGRSRELTFWWNADGPIAFDYGAKTYRFGDGVDEAEAKQIVKLIQTQFPQYAG